MKGTFCIEENKNSFSATGSVTIKVFDKTTKEIVDTIVNHNLIVKLGRCELVKLIAGQSTKKINKMAIGKGGADIINSPFSPVAPVDGNTGLVSKIATNSISNTAVDLTQTNPKVTFISLFDCDIVNSLVNEIALMFDDGNTIFARYTFKTISLESGSNFSLEVTWSVEF